MALQIIGISRNGSPEFSLSGGGCATQTWSPFGGGSVRTGNAVSLPGFNGERQDPLSGVSHLGNGYRAYSPVLRRFTCPDSESPFGVGGINPYVYCDHDPVNQIDPSGHGFKKRLSSLFGLHKKTKIKDPDSMSVPLSDMDAQSPGTSSSSRSGTGVLPQVAEGRKKPASVMQYPELTDLSEAQKALDRNRNEAFPFSRNDIDLHSVGPVKPPHETLFGVSSPSESPRRLFTAEESETYSNELKYMTEQLYEAGRKSGISSTEERFVYNKKIDEYIDSSINIITRGMSKNKGFIDDLKNGMMKTLIEKSILSGYKLDDPDIINAVASIGSPYQKQFRGTTMGNFLGEWHGGGFLKA